MAIKRISSVYEDPAIINLLEKVPDKVKQTFTEEQLLHLRNAVVSRQWRHHPIDIRGTLPWFKYRYYYVLIAGKNKRELSRTEIQVSRLFNGFLLASFLTISALIGLLILYLFKSALGINLFDNYSLGIWDWFKAL